MRSQFRGSIVALVTPMSPDESVDFFALTSLVEWHIAEGTDGIVAVGTTGESATLTVEEHLAVIKHVVDVVKGRVPVIAGTGANSTREAIELTAAGYRAGAQACLSVTPYYNKPPQEGLYRHYRKIAEAVPVPLILYNVPGRTGCDMVPATVKRLAEIENIVGLKEARGEPERIRDLLALKLKDFTLLSGDDPTACGAILDGYDGDISVTANVAPRLMHLMCAAALEGDREKAEALDRELSPLHSGLFVEPNPIPTKWALGEMGKIASGIRLPLVPLAADFHAPMRQALKASGVL